MKRKHHNLTLDNHIPTNRELVRSFKSGKPPKKKYKIFIPELRAEIYTDKDPEKCRQEYLYKYGFVNNLLK